MLRLVIGTDASDSPRAVKQVIPIEHAVPKGDQEHSWECFWIIQFGSPHGWYSGGVAESEVASFDGALH